MSCLSFSEFAAPILQNRSRILLGRTAPVNNTKPHRDTENESEVTQSCPTLCNPWTVAHQAPPSMGFSRQEYWSGLPFPSPGILMPIQSLGTPEGLWRGAHSPLGVSGCPGFSLLLTGRQHLHDLVLVPFHPLSVCSVFIHSVVAASATRLDSPAR